MNTYQKIQSALKELLNIQKPYEKDINVSNRVKQLEVFLFSLMSYADGVSILMKEEKYDSVFPVCRSFLEIYPSLIYLIENYSDINEFEKYIKKLIVDDMMQDIATYKSMQTDVTVPIPTDKAADLGTYITRWENMITQFFPHRLHEIDAADKANSLMLIIKDLNKYYDREYKALCGSKNEFIGNTVKNNRELTAYLGKDYEDSHIVYRLLCGETHGNIGTLDDRATYNGIFIPNQSSENNAKASSDLIYWSIKDVTQRFKQLLENEFVTDTKTE